MDSLVSSPVWTEHFNSEVGNFQPPISADFQTPFDLYTHTRELFALGDFYPTLHPWLRSYPPLQALCTLANKTKEPFIPKLEKPLPIALACQVALLWAALGFKAEASQLASSLEPLIMEGFSTVWTTEREFNEGETLLSFALLLRALGRITEANQLFHSSLPKDRFFAWLFEKNFKIEISSHNSPDYQLVKGAECTYVLTLNNNRAQAGTLRSGSIEIPSFGPHPFPLSNSHLFGIVDTVAKDGWFCSSSSKETWFQVSPMIDSFALQTIGADPEKPMYFLFYVRASDCIIGERLFKPKSLLRFSGKTNYAQFHRGVDKLEISTDAPLLVELIPLAGGESYWGASFLLAFRVPSLMGRILFTLKRV